MSWNVEDSLELYGIKYWGDNYLSADENGDVIVTPLGKDGYSLNIKTLANDLLERGIRLPILVRFPQIIKARVELLSRCFQNAIKDNGYQGSYQGVYPIKVNQQKHIVDEIIKYGKEFSLGLECGSKPELLIALAHMETENAFIICNGFKDTEYIETALLSQKLGKNTFIVIDRIAELPMVIELSKKHDIKPRLGLRTKLHSKGDGKWVESTGEKSKFGLSSSEIIQSIDYLKQNDMIDSLELVHYHIGSQIPSIQAIKQALKEAARLYAELHLLGAKPKYLDVGGGLGVDYDGTGNGNSSTNYNEQEYANDVIFTIQSICEEKNVPHPNIITESGRSLVAHSSMLIFDILGCNQVSSKTIQFDVEKSDVRIVQDLFDIHNWLSSESKMNTSEINEVYNDLVEKRRDTLQLFSYGVLDLAQRAKADDLYWACSKHLFKRSLNDTDSEDIAEKLKQELTDIYYCNFSVFQSLPDAWAVGQYFPVIPLQRLNEQPCRRATLVDLTCDSDGKLEHFYNHHSGSMQNYLNIHKINTNEDYYMGVFLTGAYQEILGDLHNLFGDTDAVHVDVISDNNYRISHVVEGDSVQEVLSYLEYSKPNLLEKVREACEISINQKKISNKEARLLLSFYEKGLSGYTYLEPDES